MEVVYGSGEQIKRVNAEEHNGLQINEIHLFESMDSIPVSQNQMQSVGLTQQASLALIFIKHLILKDSYLLILKPYLDKVSAA